MGELDLIVGKVLIDLIFHLNMFKVLVLLGLELLHQLHKILLDSAIAYWMRIRLFAW